MKFFPESALQQLEYEKVKTLLAEFCKSEYAKEKATNLRIHTKKEFIDACKLFANSNKKYVKEFIFKVLRDCPVL
jgi:dsDNA-specific endonuclease/ATPase MutS2